jgi:hypothetical protein
MTDNSRRNLTDELGAIKAVADALEPLDEFARRHVIVYVVEALGIEFSTSNSKPTVEPKLVTEPLVSNMLAPGEGPERLDIRSLREQKQPRSANEMAALVAYYLSELVSPDEQRQVVTSPDIEKYFKQANYRLPGRVSQTLPDAARAGYFDLISRGQYKLNPVGYNLVAHGMPSGTSDAPSRSPKSRRPPVKKSAKTVTAKKVASSKSVNANVAPTKRPRRKNT